MNRGNSVDLESPSRSFTCCQLFEMWLFVQLYISWQDFNWHGRLRLCATAIDHTVRQMMLRTGLYSGSADVQDVLTVWIQRREHVVLDGVWGAQTRVRSGCCRRESAIHLRWLHLYLVTQRGLLQWTYTVLHIFTARRYASCGRVFVLPGSVRMAKRRTTQTVQ